MPHAARMSAEMAIVPLVGAGFGGVDFIPAIVAVTGARGGATGLAVAHAVAASIGARTRTADDAPRENRFAFMIGVLPELPRGLSKKKARWKSPPRFAGLWCGEGRSGRESRHVAIRDTERPTSCLSGTSARAFGTASPGRAPGSAPPAVCCRRPPA